MTKRTSWVGLDVHKKDIAVAGLFAEQGLMEWRVEHTPASVTKLAKRLRALAGDDELVACYEAGACGYALQRRLEECGVRCMVIAPSLVPHKPGERIKTDRRDAKKLAQMLRAGLLTEVRPPTPKQEAARDLCRCRDDAREDLMRARHRLGKFLLRRGIRPPQPMKSWGDAHRRWLRGLKVGERVDQRVFDDYLQAIEQVDARIRSLDEELAVLSEDPLFAKPVAALRCFRGIDTHTAIAIVAELHGIERFESPRKLMAYLGLVPTEHSSGDAQRRGGITKAGNKYVRRMLIEAAWHYRGRALVGPALKRRREGQPPSIIAIADRAQTRLNMRYWRLSAHRKPPTKIVTALARELAGFVWAALRTPEAISNSNAA